MNMAQRPSYMSRGTIWQWDKTSHGGIVISGCENSTWNGVRQARLGDIVFCPKCKPYKHTISKVTGMSVHGIQSATHGDLTSCGAFLIGQQASTKEISEMQLFLNDEGFNDRYILRDSNGNPMPNTYYGSQKEGGSIEYGTTDEQGHTHLHLTGIESQNISIYIAG